MPKVPPPPKPPIEAEILKYQVTYDVPKSKASIELFFHATERRIQGGKMSVIKTVKTRVLEGDLLEMLFVLDLLRNEKVIYLYDEDKGPLSLKTLDKEASKEDT